MKTALIFCLLVKAAVCASVGDTPNPEAELLPTQYTVNQTAIFLCQFQRLFPPQVVWLKDGSPLPDSPKFTVTERTFEVDSPIKDDPILSLFKVSRILTVIKISDLQPGDSGRYTCMVSNDPGSGKRENSFNIEVSEPEQTLRTISEHETTHLVCEGVESPDSTAIWLKNGSPLPTDRRFLISEKIDENEHLIDPTEPSFQDAGVSIKEYVYTMTLFNAQHKDSSNYTCRVFNTETKKYHDERFKLVVEDASGALELSAKAYGERTIYCEVQAQHPAEITWLKDDQPLPDNPRYLIIDGSDAPQDNTPPIFTRLGIDIVFTVSKLEIQNVQFEDAGVYSCIDESPLNFNNKRDYVLHVEEPAKRFLQSSVGDTPLILCGFTTRYIPQILWLKNGLQLPEDPRLKVVTQSKDIQYPDFASDHPLRQLLPTVETNSLLQIYGAHIDDSATYTCYIANSPTGKKQRHFEVNVKEKEETPFPPRF